MNSKVRFCTLVLLLQFSLLLPAAAKAARVSGNVGSIVRLLTYSTFGNGDVAIKVSAPLATCGGGFWLRAQDPGFKNAFALLLSARVARMPIIVSAYDDQIWSGSSDTYCRIDMVDFVYD